jgi:hypothetical protein
VLIRKNITKITASYGLHTPDPWYGMVFTIKRAQIRTYIAKIGGHCISSTSEISKYNIDEHCHWRYSIETHPDRPRHLWGIGSKLGYPSKYQSRPRATHLQESYYGPPDDISRVNISVTVIRDSRSTVDLREPKDLKRRTEITPVKDSHTRIKPLALASGHGRYITVTPERELVSVGEWLLHTTVINL